MRGVVAALSNLRCRIYIKAVCKRIICNLKFVILSTTPRLKPHLSFLKEGSFSVLNILMPKLIFAALIMQARNLPYNSL